MSPNFTAKFFTELASEDESQIYGQSNLMKLCRDHQTYANGAPCVAPLIVSGSKEKTRWVRGVSPLIRCA